MSKKVVLTAHAALRLIQRGISAGQCKTGVEKPDEVMDDPAADGRMRAWGIPEGEDKAIRVVYVEDGDTVRIVTAMHDRNWRKGA